MIIPMGMTRYDLFQALPKQANVAEIGVWNGENAQAILQLTNPSKFYLIDSWGPIEDPQYEFDPAYSSFEDGDKSYQEILNKFKNQIESGQIEPIRSLSSQCYNRFPDNYFDWIYIDGDHSYEGALKDLHLYDSKVKDDGFILGHDYTKGSGFGWNFGVIEAVNQFVKTRNYHLLALTLSEGFPTYLISKTYGSAADSVLFNIAGKTKFIFEIDNFLDFNFQHDVVSINNQNVVICKLKGK